MELFVTVPPILVVPKPSTLEVKVPSSKFKFPAFDIPLEIFRSDAFVNKKPEFIFNLL